MYSFREVSRRVFKNECSEGENWLELYNEDIYKRHKNYFNDLAKVLMIENDALEALKKEPGKKFAFTEEGAKLLEDLLTQYGKSMKQKDRTSLTKNLEKRIFRDNQYNEFVPEDIQNCINDIILANNLVLLAMETFCRLFLDAGFSEEETEKIMEKADMKFGYSKRKIYQGTMELFKYYLMQLDKVNVIRHNLLELTEKENAIWLNYANSELKETIMKVLKVRNVMVMWAAAEIKVPINKKYLQMLLFNQMDDVEKSRINELKIQEKLMDLGNKEIQNMITQYEEIVGDDFNPEKFIAIVLAIPKEIEDEDVIDLLLAELLKIPASGNNKTKKSDVEKIKVIFRKIYSFVNEEKKKYKWPDIFKSGRANRIRDEELLEKAKEFAEHGIILP